MKKSAITYWLIPAAPMRTFFQGMINDLARRYNAPRFEPHMTIHVGLDQSDVAEEVIAKTAMNCGSVSAKALKVSHSSEFIKTLFVQFALNAELRRLSEIVREGAQGSSEYEFKPHLSLLYKKMSIRTRCRLTDSIKLPVWEVVFESIKAVRCVSPTRNCADVEAWRVVAAKELSG
jgi:2'-5' RNA ligase